MLQLNEQQRIAAYQRGWNDAQRGRAQARNEPIMYQVGYIEASKGSPNRFIPHEAK
jgi:hypothetical protein